jgi:hypothetical protein
MQSSSYSQSILVKTPLGLAELRGRSQKISMSDRQVLILADGKRTIKQIQQLLSTPVAETLDRLQAMGLLEPLDASSGNHVHNLLSHENYQNDSQFDEVALSDFSSDSGLDTAADALDRFEAASTHFFRTKAVVASTPQPVAPAVQVAQVAHQAATARGILHGKSYLVDTLDRLLPVDGAILTRKIALINSEAALYYAFEQAIHAIKKRAGPGIVQDITRRFDEEISRQ